jgi:hypothetical protein
MRISHARRLSFSPLPAWKIGINCRRSSIPTFCSSARLPALLPAKRWQLCQEKRWQFPHCLSSSAWVQWSEKNGEIFEEEYAMSEEQRPPIIGRVKAEWRDERVVLTLLGGQELAYTQEQCDGIYSLCYEQRHLLAGASFITIPTPDGEFWFPLSGEGAVLLYAFLRDLRQARNIPDPAD